MYSLKVRGVREGAMKQVENEHSSASTPADERTDPTSPSVAASSCSREVESVSFSAGNPRVEHITGIVHLYRHLTDEAEAAEQSNPPAFSPSLQHSAPATHNATILPANRSTLLCVLALPPDMGFPEFCAFLGTFFERVREIRLVRREGGGPRAACLALLHFDGVPAADDFYGEYNGKPFCLLEPDIVCRLLFVQDVEICDRAGGKPQPSTATTADHQQSSIPPRPPPGTAELPSCPVCLERLDEHVSGVVTTVCNHRFHNQCLRQWGDASCPVCRYSQSPGDGASRCSSCGTAVDLWICLICGHVGCGRYRGSHAAAHWQESGHGYALDLESQRVWDYASDAYVHRLIRSKTDGKLVEVAAPCAGGAGGTCGDECGAAGSSAQCVSLDPEMEEALVISKLDALATEYGHLLVTQLESQRAHFEALMIRERQELEAEIMSANARAQQASENEAKAVAAASEADRRRQRSEDKLADVSGRLEQSNNETDFLRQLNETLLANQKDFAQKLQAAATKATEREAVISDLREQIRDLMVFIEAREAIERGSAGEVAGGTVLPVPDQPKNRIHGARGKRH